MKAIFNFIIKIAIFWLLLFFIQRNIFLLYFFKQTSFSFKEWMLSNTHSFAMDIATICYILLPISFLLIILSFKETVFIKKLCNILIITLVVISNFILISDIGLYAEWSSKINPKAISYLAYPKEALASTKATPIFLLLILFFLQTIAEIFIYKKYFRLKDSFKNTYWLKKVFFFIFFYLY
jgi:hypothetical protein